MGFKKSDMNIPILVGYPVGPRLSVWCPYCVQYHFHGSSEGHRIAHCIRDSSPFNKTGYYVKPATEEDLEFIGRDSKRLYRNIMSLNKSGDNDRRF